MIKIVNRLILILAVGFVALSGAFAETIKKEVMFTRPFVVNGIDIKPVRTPWHSMTKPTNFQSSKVERS